MNTFEWFSDCDSSGVWPLLLQVSGHAAMERGSEAIEPIDLLKAIYIVDLEHVAKLWGDWEDFEKLVSNQKLISGQSTTYLNRTLYILYLHLSIRGSANEIRSRVLGSPSKQLGEVLEYARLLASKRNGVLEPPTSRDFLFSIVYCDPTMRKALQHSGLMIDKLAELVGADRP